LRRYHAQQSHESLTAPSAGARDLLPTRDHIVDANYYAHCLSCALNPANLTVDNHPMQIEKDLHRTFPDNQLYESTPVMPTPAPAAAVAPSASANSNNNTSASPAAGTASTLPSPVHRHTSSAGLNMLRRVLLAYSFHNPGIGYCQSINFVTALLLLFMDEEEAFYMLCVILEDVCCIDVSSREADAAASAAGVATHAGDDAAVGTAAMAAGGGGGGGGGGVHGGVEQHDEDGTGDSGTGDASKQQQQLQRQNKKKMLYYHSPDLSGAHIDQKVFADLVAEKLPRVAAQFERLSFPLAPLAMSWHLCLFVNTLPLETVLVIWDCLFSEGIKIALRASLTLLKVHERHILRATDFEELLMVLKTLPAFHPTMAPAEGGVSGQHHTTLVPPQVDTATFMKIAFDPSQSPAVQFVTLRLHAGCETLGP
jgi:hypothetical protein